MLPQQLIENSYLARYLLLNQVDITDYEVFAGREIQNSPDAFHFAYAENDPSIPPLLDQSIPTRVKNAREESIDSFLARMAPAPSWSSGMESCSSSVTITASNVPPSALRSPLPNLLSLPWLASPSTRG